MGTGTGTTAWAGVFGVRPTAGGPCGSIAGGAGVLTCAKQVALSNKATQTKVNARFMDGKAEKSSEVPENQDLNLHEKWLSNTTDIRDRIAVQL
jgi:hypothetical protein